VSAARKEQDQSAEQARECVPVRCVRVWARLTMEQSRFQLTLGGLASSSASSSSCCQHPAKLAASGSGGAEPRLSLSHSATGPPTSAAAAMCYAPMLYTAPPCYARAAAASELHGMLQILGRAAFRPEKLSAVIGRGVPRARAKKDRSVGPPRQRVRPHASQRSTEIALDR
jgi:hypothetical protein